MDYKNLGFVNSADVLGTSVVTTKNLFFAINNII